MKRFTETNKWGDPWFRRLSQDAKLLWLWLLDNCDSAGVIDIDLELASFQTGHPKGIDTLSELDGRIVKIPCGKWHIVKFIEFQYGQLSEECKPHKPIFQSIKKHEIKGYSKGIDTLQEKEKEKDKEKEQEKARGTIEDLCEFAVELGLEKNDGVFIFEHWEANGWKNGNNPSKSWKAGMRKWKTGKFFPSQKQNYQSELPTMKPIPRGI